MADQKNFSHWMLVAHDLKHLATLKTGDRSWWCVPGQFLIGEKAFIYKPKVGIMLYVQIGTRATDRNFCQQYKLHTANVQVLKVFDPPIAVKQLRQAGPRLKEETFLRRQFQGSSFKFVSEVSVSEILSLIELEDDATTDTTGTA